MKYRRTLHRNRAEDGVALLIALFVLLLISVVGIALITASSSETSLGSNYRNSSSAFYASLAGIEEARGRLLSTNPNYFGAFIPGGAPLALGQARYILNAAPGEAAGGILAKYPDTLYDAEFTGTDFTPPATQTTASMFTGAANPGPLYKWVRINAITEKSININVGNHALPLDSTTPLYFDGASLNLAGAGAQALEITALAVSPNGSQKTLQYIVAPHAPTTVGAAMHTNLDSVLGNSLNISGLKEASGLKDCVNPDTYGVKSTGAITGEGQKKATGLPDGTLSNTLFPYNLPALISSLSSGATPIDSPETGVTANDGTPKAYTGAHPVLGTAPVHVIYDDNGAITSIETPGKPVTYLANGNLTVGTPAVGGATPSGQGILVVNGNLLVDITNGFDYFGLILVGGNVTFVANKNDGAKANVHGAVLAGGRLDAAALADLERTAYVRQNACMVQDALNQVPYTVLSFREK